MNSYSCPSAVCRAQMVLFLWARWASAVTCARGVVAFASEVLVAVRAVAKALTAIGYRAATRVEQARATDICRCAESCHQRCAISLLHHHMFTASLDPNTHGSCAWRAQSSVDADGKSSGGVASCRCWRAASISSATRLTRQAAWSAASATSRRASACGPSAPSSRCVLLVTVGGPVASLLILTVGLRSPLC